ncbi:MAG: triose-phosphate isomerase [Bdellovibrionales bacterium]|nr:triose-phosphate isomerase [Bdellovibrionales bacterium]
MICAANWKMNMGVEAGESFLREFKNILQKGEEKHFLFFPPAFLSFLFVQENLYWGGQNVFFQKNGAWTGENSPEVLKELSAQFCLLGHSERRLIFGETEEDIEKKFHLLRSLNILPVLCVGEKDSERNQKDQILRKQLNFLKKTDLKVDPKKPMGPKDYEEVPFIVAYEPVWAIGSGKTPSANEINEIHQMIKNILPLNNIPVLYGGSVTENNAASFGREPDVDGFLVGGASLKADSFYSIFQAGKNA